MGCFQDFLVPPVGTGCWRTVFPSFGVVFGRGVTGKRCDSTVVTRCDSTKSDLRRCPNVGPCITYVFKGSADDIPDKREQEISTHIDLRIL